MLEHSKYTDHIIRRKIKSREITFAGNAKLKIFGTLSCSSGKRMKKIKRIFFTSCAEAIENNFRPCGHCMKAGYKNWKNGSV
jgi:methylphosphotriester-DNA--protein-cysteine methyltransferase